MVSVVAQPVSRAAASSTASKEDELSGPALFVIMAVPMTMVAHGS